MKQRINQTPSCLPLGRGRLIRIIFVVIYLSVVTNFSNSQPTNSSPIVKWSTWTLLQALPTISFFEDRNTINSKLKFGLEWQVIPLSYSFGTNKYVPRLNFFFINPVKRFSGSAELFYEPELVTGGFQYSGLQKFMFKSGGRIVLPLAQGGEYLSFSLGAGYYYQKQINGNVTGGPTYEGAIYSFFGMLGLKFDYNQNAVSSYNIGLYIKYY